MKKVHCKVTTVTIVWHIHGSFSVLKPIEPQILFQLDGLCCDMSIELDFSCWQLLWVDEPKAETHRCRSTSFAKSKILAFYRGPGRKRAILAYEISWFLFDFPQNDVIRCKSGWGWRVGLISELDFKKSALISHDFNWFLHEVYEISFVADPSPSISSAHIFLHCERSSSIDKTDIDPRHYWKTPMQIVRKRQQQNSTPGGKLNSWVHNSICEPQDTSLEHR